MSNKYKIAQILEEALEGYTLDDKLEGLRIVSIELYNEKFAEEEALDEFGLAGMTTEGGMQ